MELPAIQTYTSSATNYNPVDWITTNSLSGNISNCLNIAGSWPPTQTTTHAPQGEKETMSNRRIVQVFIADPNESVPLEKSLLYQDDKPHLTDLTDQELFFEIDIKSVLAKHNAYRVTVTDKEASEGKNKDVMLEAAKIRDLKMTVVEVAKF
jgi:hypothetical protein